MVSNLSLPDRIEERTLTMVDYNVIFSGAICQDKKWRTWAKMIKKIRRGKLQGFDLDWIAIFRNVIKIRVSLT